MKNIKPKKKIIAVALVGIVVVATVAGVFIFNRPKPAAASWWNDNWQYRQSVEVTNNASQETDVYISLTIDTSATSSFQSDCGDLRFVTEAGEVLSYYIVSGCGTTNTVIHVNFSVFPAGTQTIYYYYGNPTAENGFSASDFSTEASNYTIGAIGSQEVGPGPVGYWSFDEGYGTTAHDESGHGNDGTITGASWQDESMCVSGKCLYFDGSGDYVDISPDLAVEAASDEKFTWSLWIRPLDINTRQVVMSATDNDGFGDLETVAEFNIGRNGEDYEWMMNDTAASRVNIKTSTTSDWQYWTGVKDGSNMFFYINGILQKSINTAGNSAPKSPTSFRIGSPQLATRYFHGYIDEVKIYPYARTAEEVRQDYAAGKGGARSRHGVGTAFGSQFDSWLTDGLVGYWKLDETATTSGAADSSGNGNTGTFYGNASTTAGKFGNGGVFDGSGDWIDVGDQDYFSPAENNLTIAFWAQTPSTAAPVGSGDCGDAGAYFITKGMSNSDWEWGVENDNNSKLCLVLWQSNGVDHAKIEVNYSINDNAWHYYTAVINYLNQVSFYLDGVLIGETKSFTGTMVNGNDNVLFGRRGDNSYFFNGKIDEVRIYNRALSPDEVRKLYEWASGPVAWWKLDEGAGQTVYDSSGNGHDGTLTNGPVWARGKYGGALSFDHNDDYVNIGNINENALSLTFWFKSNVVINKDTSTRFPLQTDTNLGILMGDSTSHLTNEIIEVRDSSFSKTGWCSAADSISAGWHHLAVSFNDTTYKIYLDGIRKDNCQYGTQSVLTANNVLIGKHTSFKAWDGLIDDVRIYNYALTQKQILEVMNGGDPSRPGRAHKSPVLYLSFDEGQGETAHDSNPICKDLNTNCNNGTLYPGTGGSNTATSAMWSLEGKFGRAMEFDGVDDYVNVGSNDSIDDLWDGGGTFVAWIYARSDGGGDLGRIADKKNISDDQGWDINVREEDSNGMKLFFTSTFTTGDWRWTTVNRVINKNEWTHIVVVYNSDDVDNEPLMYVNSERVDIVKSSSASGSRESDSGNPLIIGNRQDFTRTFDGLIDEVKIWNYALSEDEIKAEYNRGASVVMGSVSTASSSANVLSNEASREYCVPGDTSYCAPPVLELKFDEKQGSTAYDTSGNGNNGTINGATWARGKFGSALEFDGVDDDVNFSTITFNNAFTISSWAYFLNDQTAIVVGRDSGVPTDRIERYNNFLFYEIADNGVVDTGFDLDKNKWYYIALVRDNNDYVKVYVDGKLEFSSTATSSGVSYWDSIGDYDDAYHINGLIDQVRIYNYARTPAQIAWEYNRGKPIAWWRFDECSGGTIHDESGNGNHGTLYLGTTGVTATGTCASSSNSFWYNGHNGKINAAGSFDGSDDYIGVGDTGYNINSIGFWIKPDSLSEYVIDLDGGTHYIRLNSGVVTAVGFNSPTVYVDGQETNITQDTNWHYVLITTNTAIDANSTSIAKVGSNYFDGLIDEVKIWNYALTPEQVKMEYNSGAVRFGN